MEDGTPPARASPRASPDLPPDLPPSSRPRHDSMATKVFNARSRIARSSPTSRAVVTGALLFFLTLFFYRSLFPRDTMTATNGHEITPGSALTVDISSKKVYMPLRLVTFNIRYATTSPGSGEKPWDVRCPKLCSQLNFISAGHESPFFCFQEALYPQIQDIHAHLGSSWSYIGRGRYKDPQADEFSPIFYRSDFWRLERSETRWLSPTPDVPSRGWDAALNRIVTMGAFAHRATGTRVVVMSTHFDHRGEEARMNSARLLIQFAKEWRGEDAAAVLVGGDFNSMPEDGAYQVMTGEDSGMSDISDLVPEAERYGNQITYTSFGEPNEFPKRIDFLFIQEPRRAVVKTFGVLSNRFDDKVRLSDHRAVVADLDIPV